MDYKLTTTHFSDPNICPVSKNTFPTWLILSYGITSEYSSVTVLAIIKQKTFHTEFVCTFVMHVKFNILRPIVLYLWTLNCEINAY